MFCDIYTYSMRGTEKRLQSGTRQANRSQGDV